MPDERDPADADEEEAARLKTRRMKAAKRAGLEDIDAELFAVGDTSLKLLRRCITKGATPEQIAKIVV